MLPRLISSRSKSGTENLKLSPSETWLDWRLLSHQVGINIRGKIRVFPLEDSVSERLRNIGLSAVFQNKTLKYTLTLSSELHLTVSKLWNKHVQALAFPCLFHNRLFCCNKVINCEKKITNTVWSMNPPLNVESFLVSGRRSQTSEFFLIDFNL